MEAVSRRTVVWNHKKAVTDTDSSDLKILDRG